VRRFSEALAGVLRESGPGGRLFPIDGKLKGALRDAINAALFHDAALELHTVRARTELKLAIAGGTLPTMAWTAGQREFVPLLLALYSLLPSGAKTKNPDVDWIVLEEPEMGLHPDAILAVMLLVLDLLKRGHRVLLSTHHPLVLDIIWALQRVQEHKRKGSLLWVLKLFGQEDAWHALKDLADAALRKRYTVSSFGFAEDGFVHVKDISTLDPGSEDPNIAGWGGLAGRSGRIADVVAEAISR
jgi:hypothetical protein